MPPDAPPPPFMGAILPAGMPPGTEYPSQERAPEGVLYFRIFGGISAFVYGMLALLGGGLMVVPTFLSTIPPGVGDEVMGFYLAGTLYGVIGLAHAVPTLVALFAGRKPWVHTLGTVVLALGMLNMCCIPVLIPLMIVWLKPETRRWFGAG